MKCDSTDFMFPMQADVFYPSVEQDAYGQVEKAWMLDRTIAGSFVPVGSSTKESLTISDSAVIQGFLISGRIRCDLRKSSLEKGNALTNIILTNIRDASGNEIYTESSGIRSGKSTIFEVATHEPFIGAFGSVEHYRVVLRRSENQGENV
jgi:hypothetical protein